MVSQVTWSWSTPEYAAKHPGIFKISYRFQIFQNLWKFLNFLGIFPTFLDWDIFHYSQCLPISSNFLLLQLLIPGPDLNVDSIFTLLGGLIDACHASPRWSWYTSAPMPSILSLVCLWSETKVFMTSIKSFSWFDTSRIVGSDDSLPGRPLGPSPLSPAMFPWLGNIFSSPLDGLLLWEARIVSPDIRSAAVSSTPAAQICAALLRVTISMYYMYSTI